MTLAKCWLACLPFNYDGGVGKVAVDWSLVPGRQSLRSVQQSLRDVYMDSAMPLYRNQQWQQECRRRGMQIAGHDQRKLAATLLHEPHQPVHGSAALRKASHMLWPSREIFCDGKKRELVRV